MARVVRQHATDSGTLTGSMNFIRIGSILALMVASFSACAPQRIRPMGDNSPATIAILSSNGACRLASNVWTCSPNGYHIGTITMSDAQEIRMKPGASDGQFFTIRLAQDSHGGLVPIWGKMF